MNSVRVMSSDNHPTLYINEDKVLPMFYGLSDIPGASTNTHYAWVNIRNFAKIGIHLVSIDVELRQGWFKQSAYECESIQAEIAAAQVADPLTGILIRLHMNPPYWWLRDNSDETVLYDGELGIDDGEGFRLIRDDHNHHLRVSLASKKWLSEAGDCLRKFCENTWNTEEGKAVVGIQLACGINGEWHQWGNDCSVPMKRRFQLLLTELYADDYTLQVAWNDPSVTIYTAEFAPNPAQTGDDGIFRDPMRSRRIMDAQLCIQKTVPEAILHFCKIIKESWGRPVLTGAFYGYYIGTGGDIAPISGHLLPQLLYSHPELIDFLCAPCPYMQNRRPECIPMQRGLLESNRLRGKLWLTEMDEGPIDIGNYPGGDPNRIDETIAQLRRNILIPLLAGHGLWLYDHRTGPRTSGSNKLAASIYRKTGWWENPSLLKQIKLLHNIGRVYCQGAYKPAADVLLVYCPESHFITNKFVNSEYETQEAISRTGAAYDCIYLNELSIAELARYRCIIFPDAYYLTASQREEIAALIKGKCVVWLYAAGFADENSANETNIAELTGFHICRIKPEVSYRVISTGNVYLINSTELNPTFAIDDSQAELVAVYEKSGACAVAKKGNQWYFSLPRLDIDTACEFVNESGAHRYCRSNEPIIAGNGIVALNSYTGGDRELTFRNGEIIQCYLPPHTTAVFDSVTGERLL